MHRLVQAVLSDSIPPDLRRQWRERVLRAVNASFPEVDFKDWKQCGRLLPHALVCAMWTDELTTTLEFSELLHKAGVYLREQGLYIPRIAQRACGRAKVALRSERCSKRDAQVGRDGRNRMTEREKGAKRAKSEE
jgi:hypothetical protein